MSFENGVIRPKRVVVQGVLFLFSKKGIHIPSTITDASRLNRKSLFKSGSENLQNETSNAIQIIAAIRIDADPNGGPSEDRVKSFFLLLVAKKQSTNKEIRMITPLGETNKLLRS